MGRHVQAQVKVPVDGARAGDDDLIKASQLRQDGESMRAIQKLNCKTSRQLLLYQRDNVLICHPLYIHCHVWSHVYVSLGCSMN